jgi:hypothetical protein
MDQARRHPPFDAASYVDAAARACGLELSQEMRAGAIANLDRTAAFARLLDDGLDGARTEPAPVFAPRRP